MTALSHLPNLLSLLASVDQILSQTVSAAQPTSFAGLNSNKKYTPSPGLEIQQVITSLWWGGMRLRGTCSPSWEVDAVHFQLHLMYFGNPGKRKRLSEHFGCPGIDLTYVEPSERHVVPAHCLGSPIISRERSAPLIICQMLPEPSTAVVVRQELPSENRGTVMHSQRGSGDFMKQQKYVHRGEPRRNGFLINLNSFCGWNM